MLTNGVWSYTYDAENRLPVAYSNSLCVVSNAYDYMGRRVLKVTTEAVRTFVYDGWNLVQELTHTQTHTLTNFYVWGKDISGTMQGAGGVGGLLAVSINGQYFFPFQDANGNITAYVDEPGTVVAEYTYDTFGATYPIRYGYDAIGRMNALSTTRTGTAWDSTHWRYDFATGLVMNKVHADNSVVSYAYTPDGKPLRTTWARGSWKEQAYNANGLLYATTYSDATPAVSLVYDVFQRLAAVSNEVAAYVYANSPLGTATNETATVGGEVCTLTRRLDDRHRLASLSVGDAQAHFGYDVENRLATVSNAVFTVAYAYTIDGWDAGYSIALTNGTTLSRIVARDACRRQLVTAITSLLLSRACRMVFRVVRLCLFRPQEVGRGTDRSARQDDRER